MKNIIYYLKVTVMDNTKIFVKNTIIHIFLYFVYREFLLSQGIYIDDNGIKTLFIRKFLLFSICFVSFLEIQYKKNK